MLAHSTGATYHSTTVGLSDMLAAIDQISAPILLQHADNDTLVPVTGVISNSNGRLGYVHGLRRLCL